MLRLHKLRAFLTMLGVIIGVMSVTLISMISSGFQYYIKYEFQKLGSDTIFLFYDGGSSRMGRNAMIEGMEYADLELLMSQARTLDIGSANLQLGSLKVSYGDKSVSDPSVEGTDENNDDLNKFSMVSGRYFSKEDLQNRANVCVIGQEIRDRLFGTEPAEGKLVTFTGITLEVIGVMENVEMMGQSNKKDIFVPLTTAQDKWRGGDQISYITTRPKDGISVEEAMDDAWRVLMAKSGNKRVYRMDSRESIMNVFGNILGVAGAVLAGIAALSLLVGGIGIMNIMLVSVTERTREVGLRKAVGAKRWSIMLQFLVEAVFLSVIGGFIGMGIAFMFGQLVSLITASANFPSKGGLQMAFPLSAALISTGISAVIGVIFGLYPAARASSLSPIEALRTE
jgi:putative ABC transport system permease protein